MPKCVVSGYIGFDNFGDEAIASILTKKLKQDGSTDITLISSNPKKTASLYNVNSCSMFGFLLPIIKCDKLISGGGSLLQDVTSLKSLIYYLCVIYTALLFKKKVEIYAQGIGPIKSKLGIFLTKFALRNADKISVRDKKSQELLNSWNIKSELVKDPVFDIQIERKNIESNTVGVQLRAFNGVTESFLKKLSAQIKETFPNNKIIVLSFQNTIDNDICNKFASYVGGQVYSNMTVEEAIEKIASLKYLIAMRFHANVIGIKANVKTLAINYDPKVEKLAQEYNLPVIGLEQEDFSSEFSKLIN